MDSKEKEFVKHMLSYILGATVLFGKSAWGSINAPYATYRGLSQGKHIVQAYPIFLLTGVYFAWATLIHRGIKAHPLFLSLSFGKIAAAALITHLLIILSIVAISRIFKGKGSIKTVFLPWTYSLLPTLAWFFGASVLYILFPPPRTESIPGQALTLVFLILSLFLFFWKAELYYLTIRHGMRLTLPKIFSVSAILFPIGALYAISMYKLGIFRIPFI